MTYPLQPIYNLYLYIKLALGLRYSTVFPLLDANPLFVWLFPRLASSVFQAQLPTAEVAATL